MHTSFHLEEQGMRFLAMVCLGLAAAVANPAAADPFARGFGFRPSVQDQRPRPEQQGAAGNHAPQRAAGNPAPQRDTRAPGEPDRSRMSPDERRQLRRDVQDAGKDIYQRDRPAPAPRREQRR
jgi:hypothetical protein